MNKKKHQGSRSTRPVAAQNALSRKILKIHGLRKGSCKVTYEKQHTCIFAAVHGSTKRLTVPQRTLKPGPALTMNNRANVCVATSAMSKNKKHIRVT